MGTLANRAEQILGALNTQIDTLRADLQRAEELNGRMLEDRRRFGDSLEKIASEMVPLSTKTEILVRLQRAERLAAELREMAKELKEDSNDN